MIAVYIVASLVFLACAVANVVLGATAANRTHYYSCVIAASFCQAGLIFMIVKIVAMLFPHGTCP